MVETWRAASLLYFSGQEIRNIDQRRNLRFGELLFFKNGEFSELNEFDGRDAARRVSTFFIVLP